MADKEIKEVEVVVTPRVDEREAARTEQYLKRLEAKAKLISDKANANIRTIEARGLEQRKTIGTRVSGAKDLSNLKTENKLLEINEKLKSSIALSEKKTINDIVKAQEKSRLSQELLNKRLSAVTAKVEQSKDVESLKSANRSLSMYEKEQYEKLRHANKMEEIYASEQIKQRGVDYRAKQKYYNDIFKDSDAIYAQRRQEKQNRFLRMTSMANDRAEESIGRTFEKSGRKIKDISVSPEEIRLSQRKQRAYDYLAKKYPNKEKLNQIMQDVDKGINDGLKKRMNDRVRSLFSAKDKPYDNSPFRRMMMYLGSAMLLQYGFMMAGMAIRGLLQSVSDTEIKSLQGRNYREDLLRQGRSTAQFDTASERYSQLTGMQLYEARGNIGDFFGKLEARNVDVSTLDATNIVSALRGLQTMYAEEPEKAQERLIKILSGKLSPEERKEYGVSSRNNPTAILEEILETLKKSPTGRIGMFDMLLRDRMRQIISAPKGMLDMVHSNFRDIFNNIGKNIGDFMSGFFQTDGGETQKRWVAFFATIEEFTNKFITKESGQSLANTILDVLGTSLAILNDVIDIIKTVNEKTGGLLGTMVRLGTEFMILKTAFGVILSPLRKIFDIVYGFISKTGVVDVPEGAKSTVAKGVGTAVKNVAPVIAAKAPVAGLVVGGALAAGYGAYKIGQYGQYTSKAREYGIEKDKYAFGKRYYQEQKQFQSSNISLNDWLQQNPESIYGRSPEQARQNFTSPEQALSNTNSGNTIVQAQNVYISDGGARVDAMVNSGLVGGY